MVNSPMTSRGDMPQHPRASVVAAPVDGGQGRLSVASFPAIFVTEKARFRAALSKSHHVSLFNIELNTTTFLISPLQ